MNNEKIKILKLLEDGKITASEAARLLEASDRPNGTNAGGGSFYAKGVKDSASTGNDRNQQQNQSQNQYRSHQNSYGSSSDFDSRNYSQSQERNNQSGRNNTGNPSDTTSFDTFADEMGRKFETLARDLEPKLQKFAEIVVEKTAIAADKISRSLSTPTETRRPYGQRPNNAPGSHYYGGMGRGGYEKNIELKVMPGNNELIISGFNAPILLKGYNGDKISAKIFCVPKRNNARIELSALGSKYFLDYDENDFEKIAIDAFIPDGMFKNITLSGYNGDVNISTLTSSFINIRASSGDVTVADLSVENLKIELENGRDMRLTNIYSNYALIESYNANISANNIEIEKLKMTAFNAAINMNVLGLGRYQNYIWAIEASNERLNINLPTYSDVGYYIKAKTSLANVKIGVTGLNYISNSPTQVEAKTIDFDSLPKKVSLDLETSNANLTVN